MRKRYLCCFAALFAATSVLADPLDPTNFRPLTKSEAAQQGSYSDLNIKKFYLDIDPDEIKNVQQRDKELKETFDRFDDALVNYKPIIRPISTMDQIMIHPYFTTTVLLPKGSVISFVDMSSEMEVLKWDQNTILLRPKKSFTIANFTVIYTLNEKNYVMNILAKYYERKDAEDRLNLVYSYRDVEKLDDLDVVQIYAKVYGELPKNNYNYVYIDDILYRIIEDGKFGKVIINGKKFRVDTSTTY
ncbi:MAG: hypothetical protein LBJ88_04100 [Campylobacteraceae bacterium]|jgi:hypothetical protein|nr:hypothetical protein [Campylobacteraceae bacterium]